MLWTFPISVRRADHVQFRHWAGVALAARPPLMSSPRRQVAQVRRSKKAISFQAAK
jgi:hypothetical protein